MKILLIFSIITLATCDVLIKEGWREVKFPWDSPHFKQVMRKLYPYTSKLINNRNGRIAGELSTKTSRKVNFLLSRWRVGTFGTISLSGASLQRWWVRRCKKICLIYEKSSYSTSIELFIFLSLDFYLRWSNHQSQSCAYGESRLIDC